MGRLGPAEFHFGASPRHGINQAPARHGFHAFLNTKETEVLPGRAVVHCADVKAEPLVLHGEQNIIVIGLSVHPSPQAIDALLAAGAAAILSKELAADDLYRTIVRFLR